MVYRGTPTERVFFCHSHTTRKGSELYTSAFVFCHFLVLLATSDGTQSNIDSKSGGHCKTHNMKLKFHICMNRTDPLCQSDDLCNGIVPTQATTTTLAVNKTSFTNYTIPTTRINSPGKRQKCFFFNLLLGGCTRGGSNGAGGRDNQLNLVYKRTGAVFADLE